MRFDDNLDPVIRILRSDSRKEKKKFVLSVIKKKKKLLFLIQTQNPSFFSLFFFFFFILLLIYFLFFFTLFCFIFFLLNSFFFLFMIQSLDVPVVSLAVPNIHKMDEITSDDLSCMWTGKLLLFLLILSNILQIIKR